MTDSSNKPVLSHFDDKHRASMVDVGLKDITTREATASARVTSRLDVLDALCAGTLPKGEGMATARIAGIMAVKRTAELIPLCHALPIDWVQVDFERSKPDQLTIRCSVKTTARTGVEMEALMGASVAALTIYDMAKAVDKGIVIGPVQLETKRGGKSGDYIRADK